jgi:hypothetical protein
VLPVENDSTPRHGRRLLRCGISIRPAPTGSTATGNTIGTVAVTCSNATTDEGAMGQDDIGRERG